MKILNRRQLRINRRNLSPSWKLHIILRSMPSTSRSLPQYKAPPKLAFKLMRLFTTSCLQFTHIFQAAASVELVDGATPTFESTTARSPNTPSHQSPPKLASCRRTNGVNSSDQQKLGFVAISKHHPPLHSHFLEYVLLQNIILPTFQSLPTTLLKTLFVDRVFPLTYSPISLLTYLSPLIIADKFSHCTILGLSFTTYNTITQAVISIANK